MRGLYDYAWFVGFAVAFAVHYALMKIAKPAGRVEAEVEAA